MLRGLYNIALKSLGAAMKRHPKVRLERVVEYAERLPLPKADLEAETAWAVAAESAAASPFAPMRRMAREAGGAAAPGEIGRAGAVEGGACRDATCTAASRSSLTSSAAPCTPQLML